jgi:hypothetical protein
MLTDVYEVKWNANRYPTLSGDCELWDGFCRKAKLHLTIRDTPCHI